MQQRDDLFTIGEFSKITGIGIHSLRYYDEIGALKPEYVDPVSNYRYYGLSQLGTIPAINMCKNAGINLSEFGDFVDEGSINYRKLVDDSRTALDRKIDEYRKRQKDLSWISSFVVAESEIRSGNEVSVFLEDFAVWAVPLGGASKQEPSYSSVSELFMDLSADARKYGCCISPICFGFFVTKREKAKEAYAFAYISEVSGKRSSDSRIITIPSGNYIIRTARGFTPEYAESVFSELISEKSDFTLFSFVTSIVSNDDPLYFVAINK